MANEIAQNNMLQKPATESSSYFQSVDSSCSNLLKIDTREVREACELIDNHDLSRTP